MSHLGEQVERHFGDGRAWGLSIAYSYEPVPLGTAAALRLAAGALEEAFVLLNGDTYLETDYAAFADRFARGGRPGLMAVYSNPGEHLAANNVRLAEDGSVACCGKNPAARRRRRIHAVLLRARRPASRAPGSQSEGAAGDL